MINVNNNMNSKYFFVFISPVVKYLNYRGRKVIC